MTAERSQLYYTSVFLHVSFQAIQSSVDASPNGDDTPCWLDAQMLSMLHEELKRCRREAIPFPRACLALETAIYHCGLLRAQCPGALNRRLCHHHLEAITVPLKEATRQLGGNASRATARHAPSTSQRLRHWLGW